MYRIMLADDEGIVIDSMTFLLKKEFGDEVIIESARSGRVVIELAESFRPDIAIMDIHMPGINGIEAMREIRKSNDRIVFIIASAYDKFDYARDAIGLGVLEYLNKPVAKESFLEIIRKAMAVIDSEREKRSQDLLVREKLETVVPVLESGLIYNLLTREHFREDIENYKNLLGIEEKNAYMIAIVFGQEQDGNHMTNPVGISVKIQEQSAMIRETVKGFFQGIVGSFMANKLPILIPTDGEGPDYNERLLLHEKAQLLMEKLKGATGIAVRAGFGSVHPFTEAVHSYNEALESMILTQDQVSMTQDLPVRVAYEENYPVETEHEIFDSVQRGDREGTILAANRYYDWMVENYADYQTDIKLKVMEFVLWAEHLAYHNSGNTYEFRSRADYLPGLLSLEDLDSIRSWFTGKLSDACTWVTGRKERQAGSVVDKAKQYIDENYGQDISLDEVSRIVDISPFYFSKLFKDGTGTTFIEYLTNIRMLNARRLIDEGELSMKEISQRVGYADANYFSRTFKKNVGLTPTEYKDKGTGI
ncbi:MAG: helix-turn-helix domain-containing protein [Lachnospiraceae bacterium]|nr:helix-turn-helix domain-containing protein [Lachnospiraceae bacterium]